MCDEHSEDAKKGWRGGRREGKREGGERRRRKGALVCKKREREGGKEGGREGGRTYRYCFLG